MKWLVMEREDFLLFWGREWNMFVEMGRRWLIVRWRRSWQRLTADRSEPLDTWLVGTNTGIRGGL